MYDTAIIGSGPAGLSAALNLKLHNKDVIWFGSGELSSKVEKSEKIANYPGPGMIAGTELNRCFKEQMEAMEIQPTDKMVTTVMAGASGYQLLAGNDIYEARTLLLAIGSVSAKGFPGEERLLGRGVSYCATCDGFLYRGKTIAVYCGDRRFEHEVRYLAELAEKVYLSAPYADSGIGLSNVERLSKPIRQVAGEARVSAIVLADQTEINVDGLFCLRGAVAPAALLPDLAMDGAHIIVNRRMETNLPGCYAAGDCTGRPYQIAKAVGEGNVAAHSILEYLS
ncbi:MAG: FAD-dependent oxidoreductase [Clostridiales bacterium]|nr:FAD-dependent oxidoreductase [Clostridiales bacterium]MCD8133744.1 FAD-dependent oxidoreductase [Clostridiales bacterium]